MTSQGQATAYSRSAHRGEPFCHAMRWPLGLLLAALILLPGCRVMVGGERTITEENDRLRAANLALQRQAAELEQQLELQEGQIDNLRQQLAATTEPPVLEGAQLPTLARLAFGRHSGPVDSDGDGRHDLIRIYLRPLDQRGRLIPVAGRATVRAVQIPDDGEPVVLAERVYEPAEFDRAWRDSFVGTHYTLELPLPDNLPSGEAELTVRVSFLQADTGARLTSQHLMTVQR